LAALPPHPDRDQVEPAPLEAPLGPGVYVHVPFCRVRCPYCDFAVRPYDSAEVPALLVGVADELAWRAPSGRTWGSLYFGGGTPSRLEPAAFTALVRALDDALDFHPGHERSLEANPEDLDPARLDAWRAAGVTRLSIGAQSLHDDELRALGRTHDAAAVERGVARARAQGFTDVSLDLMYGYPGHDVARLQASLARAIALAPEHVSAYAFTPEAGTPLGDAVRKGSAHAADADLEADLFDATRESLDAAGFRHYEISNFARPGMETLHHVNYWRRGEYLGLGPSAASFLEGRRVRAPRGLLAWAEQAATGRASGRHADTLAAASPHPWSLDDARPHAMFETAFLGLRLDVGMALPAVSPEVAAEARARWAAAGETLVREGLLLRTADGFRVPRGERARTDAIVLRWRERATA
jgi:oxygen-independent coproporphyrinogen-3 oxidase